MSNRVGLITLGCDKNTVDAEHLAGFLQQRGIQPIVFDEQTQALDTSALDTVVVLTCGFIGDAQEQSIDVLAQLLNLKASGKLKHVYAAGCLTQRFSNQLIADLNKKSHSVPDGITGVGNLEKLAEMIAENQTFDSPLIDDPPYAICLNPPRRLYSSAWAFLKIADGCDHSCTFCAIPKIKGAMHSIPHQILLNEAQTLIAQGVKELNLVAQDTSVYGEDLGAYRLPHLLRDLESLEGDFWIRCLYLYPGGITEELLDTIAHSSKIVPYLDIPLQHLDQAVIKRMRRPFYNEDSIAFIKKIRQVIPNVALRTSMIVGFPGETLTEFQTLLKGISDIQFDWLGAFEYSPEQGTAATRLNKPVSAAARRRRYHELMILQSEITKQKLRQLIGTTDRVLIERPSPDQSNVFWIARNAKQAPNVDGNVLIRSNNQLICGSFIDIEYTHVETYDLWSKPV